MLLGFPRCPIYAKEGRVVARVVRINGMSDGGLRLYVLRPTQNDDGNIIEQVFALLKVRIGLPPHTLTLVGQADAQF